MLPLFVVCKPVDHLVGHLIGQLVHGKIIDLMEEVLAAVWFRSLSGRDYLPVYSFLLQAVLFYLHLALVHFTGHGEVYDP